MVVSSPPVALHERILAKSIDPQVKSALMSKLPAEIRCDVFSHALTDYPDPSPDKAYDQSTCYTRPSYFAPRRTDTALLRTCRAIYRECWFLPFLLSEQVHWAVGDQDRAPPGYRFHHALAELAITLRSIREQQQQKFEIRSLRVFAQMFMLERGGLSQLLRIQELHPRTVTLTIRHADWWNWESDEPLKFNGAWINGVSEAMPPSVEKVNIELESLERKKYQVDEIAKQMVDKWFFRRTDGVVLFSSHTRESRWKGTSRWHGRRWVRDETREGVVDYYIVTVTFLPEVVLQRRQQEVGPIARANADRVPPVPINNLLLQNPDWERINMANPYLVEETPHEARSDEPVRGPSGRVARRTRRSFDPRNLLSRFRRRS